MTQKERIEQLEREVEILKALVAELQARPAFQPIPLPYSPVPHPSLPRWWNNPISLTSDMTGIASFAGNE